MRIVNFNRRFKQDGTWLNTWIDWNKTYCQDLHNKITSLYDYMMYQYPQYLIFNSPTKTNENDSFVSFQSLKNNIQESRLMTPYEKEVSLVIQDSPLVTQTKSFFFPTLLNFHQGFYNQSKNGDGCLVYSYTDNILLDLQQRLTDDVSCWYWVWSYNGETGTWDDTPVELPTNNPTDYIFVKLDALAKEIKELQFDLNSVAYLTWSDNIVSFNALEADSEKDRYYLFYRETGMDLSCLETTTYILQENNYRSHKTYIVPKNTPFKIDVDSIAYLIDFDSKTILYNSKLHDTLKLLPYTILNPLEADEWTNSYFKYNKKLLVVTEEPQIQYNFPSGYICILNKQAEGENNQYNPIKLQWDSYFIAPIGNGGYFDISWFGTNLIADYYENELNNFTNNMSINLAQNCRYVNPSLSNYTLKTESISIPNYTVTFSSSQPHLMDQYCNLWTGQDYIIGQTYYSGEVILADVERNIYSIAINNQKVLYFNITANKKISLEPEIWIY